MPTLVVQTAFLGDVVLTTPLLAALAERHGPVDVVLTPQAASLLAAHSAVREVVVFDKRGRDRGLRGLWRLGRVLRRRRYGRAYLPHRSARSAALAWLAGAPVRVGFAGSSAAWSYTHRIHRPTAGHEVERLLALLEHPPEPAPPIRLGLAEEDRRRAGAWLARQGVHPGFTVLAPGSAWGTKRWPYYAELAARLPGRILVVGGPDASREAERIAAVAPGRVLSAAGALSLAESAALLEHAALVVCNDSAPLHLAAAAGVRTVAVFGPTVPAFGFGPRGAGDVTVEHPGLSCRPCSTHGPMRCPLGHHRCMVDLSVEAVLKATEPG